MSPTSSAFIATGTRLSAYVQSSPSRASKLAPAALKYRRLTLRIPCTSPYQCSTRSTSAFVSAYTDSGRIACDSSTGTESGVPYTEHDDENTTWPTPARRAASSRRTVPSTLLRKYFEGSRIESPTFL
jgi:hypothetical protein